MEYNYLEEDLNENNDAVNNYFEELTNAKDPIYYNVVDMWKIVVFCHGIIEKTRVSEDTMKRQLGKEFFEKIRSNEDVWNRSRGRKLYSIPSSLDCVKYYVSSSNIMNIKFSDIWNPPIEICADNANKVIELRPTRTDNKMWMRTTMRYKFRATSMGVPISHFERNFGFWACGPNSSPERVIPWNDETIKENNYNHDFAFLVEKSLETLKSRGFDNRYEKFQLCLLCCRLDDKNNNSIVERFSIDNPVKERYVSARGGREKRLNASVIETITNNIKKEELEQFENQGILQVTEDQMEYYLNNEEPPTMDQVIDSLKEEEVVELIENKKEFNEKIGGRKKRRRRRSKNITKRNNLRETNTRKRNKKSKRRRK